MRKGLFVTFEGTEGGGKSTQILKLKQYLQACGKKVLLLREPGGTRVSEAIRAIILNKEYTEIAHSTELLLYLAARAQIVTEKIRPALQKGFVVICDRFEDSTLAYQGYGRGISLAAIKDISRLFVRGDMVPNLTILLDIDPTKGMKRGGRHDRMERQSFSFHQKVRRGFLDLAKKNPKRYHVLDATRAIEDLASEIRGIAAKCLRIK